VLILFYCILSYKMYYGGYIMVNIPCLDVDTTPCDLNNARWFEAYSDSKYRFAVKRFD